MTGLSLAPAQAICDRDVIAERWRQLRKWGPQTAHDGTGLEMYAEMADFYKKLNDDRAARGDKGVWADIWLEEVYEALAESEHTKLRKELVESAAVAVSWIEDLDNRAGDRAAVLQPDPDLVGVAA